MYYQQKRFRKIFAGLQLAAVGSMAIALATAPAARAQCIQPPSGTLVAWYPFDETASPSIDLATGNLVTWSGTLTPVPGKVAGALNFSNGYIDAPNSIITSFGPASNAAKCGGGNFSTCQGDFTIDAWVNVTTVPLSGVNNIIDARDGNPIGYNLYLYGQPDEENGHPWLGLQLGDATHGYTNYGSLPLGPGTGPGPGVGLTANAWHHVAVAVTRLGPGGTNGNIAFYLDGTLVNTSLSGPPAQTGSLVNSVPVRIGAESAANGGGSNFNGALDELQIFNKVLTAAEMKTIYKAGHSGQCKP
jgi:concanavalin A-like lectin/glucanase superfamily protein